MEQWIGGAVGLMHLHHISQADLCAHMGVCREYVNKILHGKECPKGIEDRVMAAINEIIDERQQSA